MCGSGFSLTSPNQLNHSQKGTVKTKHKSCLDRYNLVYNSCICSTLAALQTKQSRPHKKPTGQMGGRRTETLPRAPWPCLRGTPSPRQTFRCTRDTVRSLPPGLFLRPPSRRAPPPPWPARHVPSRSLRREAASTGLPRLPSAADHTKMGLIKIKDCLFLGL